MTAPTTRETADHAELVRLAEACGGKVCWTATRTGLSEYRNVSFYIYDGATMLAETNGDTPHVAAFIAAANPATVLALLSEIAALRGSVSLADRAADAMADRATQAERQRDELREALIQADLTIRSMPGTDQSDVEFIRQALANQGADQ